MKKHFKGWFSAIWHSSTILHLCGRSIVDDISTNGFCVHPFGRMGNSEALTDTIEGGWLSFICFADDLGHTSFYMSKAGLAVPEYIFKTSVSGNTIVISGDLDSLSNDTLICRALQNLYFQKIFMLSPFQEADLFWIIDTMESVTSCDYRFKKEYLQQLLIHLIHFSLKHFSRDKSSECVPDQINLLSGLTPFSAN
ncbi:hypothetical protein [Mucilaginibacter lappiensis]|uniref:Uncharacterized protein n=1 Tax=Mucilaginibacter lappiensis TaxID=354630 RepID=A0A841JRB7_9SPHI|nr:hypothetical protein [Mucilaginibacter lappiensis]MBB6130835.1 hypothetical protein [Mucilaginibacter lappiensis]